MTADGVHAETGEIKMKDPRINFDNSAAGSIGAGRADKLRTEIRGQLKTKFQDAIDLYTWITLI